MKKILNNDFILSIIGKTSNILFSFITLILLNRYLGATLKGEYTYILNYTTIISAIFQLGISTVYSKFKRENLEYCFETFISLSIIQFIIYAAITLIIVMITKLNRTVFWINLISIISIITTQFRYINLVENYRYNTLAVILMSILNCITMLIIYYLSKPNLMYAFIVYIIKDLFIVLMFFPKIKLNKLFKIEYIKTYKKIIIEGFLPMLANLLIILNYKIDIIMLKTLNINYYQIGLYSVGLSIAEYAWIIPDIFKDVIQKRTSKDNSIKSINFSLRISSSMIIIIFIGILIFGKFALKLLFGQEYEEAFGVMAILFIGVYSMIYYKVIGVLFIADNKSKQYFYILLLGAITNIIANLLLIPKYNIVGAAIASVVSYSIIGIAFLKKYMQFYNVKLRDILIINLDDMHNIYNYITK